jgi:hypothetical protein
MKRSKEVFFAIFAMSFATFAVKGFYFVPFMVLF